MRIHTSLNYTEVNKCAIDMPGVYFGVLSEHGSRSHDRAFEVQLRGNSNHMPNMGTRRGIDRFGNPEKTATWDEWGIFLNRLFEADPFAKCPYYADEQDFHYKTSWRFEDLQWRDQHKNHKWEYTGIPYSNSCKCGAERRWQ